MRLDELFNEPTKSKMAVMGQFLMLQDLMGCFLPEITCFHVPYLYNYAGPWKTQRRIHELMDMWFDDDPWLSEIKTVALFALVCFSAMGFYPVTGNGLYAIGTPFFEKIRLIAGRKNIYH